MKQTTIKRPVSGVGIGLHKGEPIKITLEPLGVDSGIVFYRSDKNVSFKAEPKNVLNTQMATVLGANDDCFVSTIEHFMSAVASYGIDNMRVILDANEIPVMDGSAISFCMMLDDAGIEYLDKNKQAILIKKEVKVTDGKKFAMLTPSKEPNFDFTISFSHPLIGEQNYKFKFSKKNFLNEIAKARTFGFLKDVQYLRSKGLALGGSLDNAVVIDENRILNPEGLRFENEFVRHKILDAIGDLRLLGSPLLGDYASFAGSHDLNHKLTLEVLSSSANYEIVTLDESTDEAYEKVFA